MKNLKNNLQDGIALIESLVAIVVVALGILGIIGMQMRTLADTQTGVRRAQAVRLIEDLSERLKVNPNAPANIGSYTVAAGAPAAAPAVPPCTATACDGQEIAAADIAQWKRDVVASLPLADAVVFEVADESVPANRRQLGVLISWRENEQSTESTLRAPFQVTTGTGASCPAGSICHLQYIQLTARCNPYLMTGTTPVPMYCPL